MLGLIIQEDVNSLYPTAMRENMPVGSGILYLPDEDGVFHSKILKSNDGSNVSKISIYWLDQKLSEFRKKDPKIHIQSGFNGVERNIGPYKLDGFCVLDNRF